MKKEKTTIRKRKIIIGVESPLSQAELAFFGRRFEIVEQYTFDVLLKNGYNVNLYLK